MEQKPTLDEILPYKWESHVTSEEAALLRATFGGNDALIAVLRKVFIPSLSDPSMPIEELGNDMWLFARDWSAVPDNEVKPLVVARQEAIKYVVNGLVRLKMYANLQNEEDTLNREQRRAKDSAK